MAPTFSDPPEHVLWLDSGRVCGIASPEGTKVLLGIGWRFLDLRPGEEWLAGRVPGALNVPLDPELSTPDAPFIAAALRYCRGREVVLYCHWGLSAQQAAARLTAAGAGRTVAMVPGFEGGRDPFGRRLPGWRELGLPIARGPEQQGGAGRNAWAHDLRACMKIGTD